MKEFAGAVLGLVILAFAAIVLLSVAAGLVMEATGACDPNLVVAQSWGGPISECTEKANVLRWLGGD